MKLGMRIAIIGGGQSARWLLFTILSRLVGGERALLNAEVTVVEARQEFGTGLAWSRDFATDDHVATKSVRLIRCEYGDSQLRQFNATVCMLRSHGVKVNLLPSSRAVAVHHERHSSAVILDSGASICCDVLVLATGYGLLSSCRIAKVLEPIEYHPRVHCCPWPATALADKVFDAPLNVDGGIHRILILGSYLTAIDAVISLASRVGTFLTQNGAELEYSAPKNVQFVMASRSGKLPRVWVQSSDDRYAPKFFSVSALEELQHKNADGFLPLDATFELMFRELLSVGGKNWPASRRIGSAVQIWRNWFGRTPPAVALRKDLQLSDSDNAVDVRNTLKWQIAIDEVLQIWSEASIAFSAEDQLQFNDTMRTSFFAHLLPMAPTSARQLDAMFRSGHLTVLGVGREYSITSTQNGSVFLTVGETRTEFSDVVNATGSLVDITKNPGALLKSLAQNGAVQPTLRRFRDSGIVKKFANMPPESLLWDRGQAFLRGPGIHVQPSSCLTIPLGATEWHSSLRRSGARAYAMGPLLCGHFTDSQSLGQVQRDATRIVTNICCCWPF